MAECLALERINRLLDEGSLTSLHHPMVLSQDTDRLRAIRCMYIVRTVMC